ncbi:MAG: amidohydrolase family protein, partial [Pirellulales bacterium]
MALFSLKARYIFPVHGPPIANGVVTIAGERIVSIGRESGGPTPIDLGNVAILPGLVNAHAHLEFSNLEEPLGEAGNSLPAWIDRVIAWRAAETDAPPAAIARGIDESVASGTALLGEIATGTATDYGAVADRIDLTLFRETIAPRPTDGEAALAAADQWLARGTTATSDCHFGLNPHAPYTVHPHIVTQLAQRSAQQHVPLAMHVAESPEEVELLASGGGPLRELLEARTAWEPRTFARPLRPLDYLERIADADRSVVIHGNYLREDELEF